MNACSASIIIAAHSEGDNVRRTVDSVLANTSDCEVILVDDASEDNGFDFLNQHPYSSDLRLKFDRLEEWSGCIRGRDRGVRLASGEDIVFLDAHMAVTPGWLTQLRRTAERWGPYAAVTPRVAPLDVPAWVPGTPTNQVLTIDDRFNFIWLNEDRIWLSGMIPAAGGCCVMLRRQLYHDVGGFDVGLRRWGCEFVDLALKIYAAGGACFYEPSVLVGHLFRAAFPYPVHYRDVTYNKVRTAYVHFSDAAFQRFTERISVEPAFADAMTDFEEKRAELDVLREMQQTACRRDPDWFLHMFLERKSLMNCSKCNALLQADDVFCGACGEVVEAAAAEPVPVSPPPVVEPVAPPVAQPVVQAPAPPVAVPPAPRRSGLGIGLVVIALVGAAGLYLKYSKIAGDSEPAAGQPSVVEPHVPGQVSTSTASIERAWLEPNVFDENGMLGVRVHAKSALGAASESRFNAEFFDAGGRPLRGGEGDVVGSSSIEDHGNQVVFVPYSKFALQPGQYSIRILPTIVDGSGATIAQADYLPLTYTESPSSILKVEVQTNSTDANGRRGFVFNTTFITETLAGPRGMVGIHFKDATRGEPLRGRDRAFTDGSGNLVTSREYAAPSERLVYPDVELFLPFDQIDAGVRKVRGEISLFDPAQNRFLTPFIPFDFEVPGSR